MEQILLFLLERISNHGWNIMSMSKLSKVPFPSLSSCRNMVDFFSNKGVLKSSWPDLIPKTWLNMRFSFGISSQVCKLRFITSHTIFLNKNHHKIKNCFMITIRTSKEERLSPILANRTIIIVPNDNKSPHLASKVPAFFIERKIKFSTLYAVFNFWKRSSEKFLHTLNKITSREDQIIKTFQIKSLSYTLTP